jgi:hypothetical protein
MVIQQFNRHRTLNPVQLMLLKLFNRDMSVQEVEEVRMLLTDYLDKKLQQQLDIDIAHKGITQTDFDTILNKNQRTKS